LGTDTAEAHPSVPSEMHRDRTFGLERRWLRIGATVAQGDLTGTRQASPQVCCRFAARSY